MNLNDFFNKISLSNKQKEEMLDNIIKSKQGYTSPVKRTTGRRLSVAAIIIIILLVITATTAVAVNLGWHEKLYEHFNPTEEQINILEPATNRPEVSVTENEVTVEVRQTLVDSLGIYVLYEITVPEEIELKDSCDWRFFYLATDNSQDNSFSQVDTKILDQVENKITCLLFLKQNTPFADSRMTMDFVDLSIIEHGKSVLTIEDQCQLAGLT